MTIRRNRGRSNRRLRHRITRAGTVGSDAMDGKRVLVVFEPVRSGAAALELARELAERHGATITVVSVAPQGKSGARCGNSALDYNLAIQDSVARDLDHARAWLEEVGVRASYELLLDGVSPSLDELAAAGRFDLVLLPARRRPMRAPGHPAAGRLRRAAGAEIQVIAPRP
jgi:nucleotide-binding universal stress UspA family protein